MLQAIAYQKRFGHALWLRMGGRKQLEQELRRAAAHCDEAIIVMTLIAMGARVDAPDPETGRTPLILAVDYECRSNIRALLANGADIHRRASNGKSALDMALLRGRAEIADMFADVHRAGAGNRPN